MTSQMRVLAALIGSLAAASVLMAQPTRPLRTICVIDAVTGRAVPYASVAWDNAARVIATACTGITVTSDSRLLVTRLGYAPWRGEVRTDADTVFVHLAPIAAALPAATARAESSREWILGARNAVSLAVDSARASGAHSTGSLVAMLPYTFPRSARGEVSLSLRGARREQVAVTLDGTPLTDPATGLADLADVPLVLLGSATVAPGSDPILNGPGAAGGVLSLQSGTGSIMSLRTAAYGDRLAEGAVSLGGTGGRLRIGASHRTARNDFAFVNASGTTGTAIDERRVNNDVTRTSAMAQWQSTRANITVLGARAELGLVGPVNVRDYDEDRSTTERLFVRATSQLAGTMLSSGLRAFWLGYRDPARPLFNTTSRALAADVDARRAIGRVLMHAGIGGDRLRGDGELVQDRTRAFVSSRIAGSGALDWSGGVRLDAIEGSGALPSFSLAVARRMRSFDVGARLAQAVRVPTLYDLYFSSPQRITVRALDAERITLDAELHARWRTADGGASSAAANATTSATANGSATAFVPARTRVTLEGAVISRTTRNAIIWFPGNFGWSPANVGTEHVSGVEARAVVARGAVEVQAWSTLYRAELLSGALRVPTPYVPACAGGAAARASRGPAQLSLATRWLGARPYTAGPRDDAFMLPSVALLDVAFSVRPRIIAADMLFTFALDNVTDRAWQSVRGFPSPGRAWSVALTLTP